uniref:Deoxyribonuclease 1 like 4, tandem duplicate 1 n=1 Tax=Maylandia zebra TaxID=106582 RepID=A0A3P9DBK1_9CICH
MSLTHECWETVIIKCENENWEVARCIIRVSKKENRFSFLLLSLSLIQNNPKTTTNKQKQNNNTVFILEVVNVTGDSVRVLVEELNGITHHYAQQLSTRLGRSRYKEQFLFLYRDDVVDLIDCYQYKDDQVDDVDAFKREPYILYFKTHNTVSCWDISSMYESFLTVDLFNVMILGDFRADGWYLSSKEREEIHIRSDKNSYWLIGDNVDTRAKTSDHHAYDRIVVYGEDMLAAIVPNSAKPFNFHKEVSDHYPVEVELLFPFG